MSLSDDKLRRARELFEELVDLTPPARAGRLRELRHLDQEIRSFTLAMLDSDRAALDMVAEPADGPEPNADIDPPPFELPGYRVGPRVGEGGSSVVYRARQLSTNRDVAIKLLRSVRLDPATRARFSYEARTASRLNHSGIARVFDSGVVRLGLDRAPYLVMEFVDGEPISEFCDSRGLGLRERLSLFGDVCDAVGHAHDRAVLHRDLKPSNILVDSAGSPRVVDFGTAISLVSDEREPAARTESGQVFGTIPYVAPERLLESGSPADVRTDVYALGVTLFELLAGRLPFDVDGRAPAELVSVVSEGRTTRLRAAIPDAPRDLDEVVARAIAFDPSFRYPSVRALSDDIGRYLDGRAVAARSGSSVYRLRKSIRRYRGPLAIGFAAAAALISVALLSIRAAQAERLARVASEDLVEFMGESFVAALEPEYAEPGRQQDRPIREVLDAAAAELDAGAGRFAEVPRVRERLERFFAETYLSIGLAPEAIAHSERVAALADSTEGPGSDRSVSARVLLAESLRASGRAQEAIAVIDMAEASTASGRASVDTLRLSVMRTRVDLLRTVDGDSERVRAAARELDDAITLLGGAGPPAPEEVAGAIETLAGVYLHLGDAENALRLVERGVKLALDSHGAAASETIAARKRRADVLRAIGRQREASEEYEDLIAIRTDRLGAEHWSTLSVVSSLGASLTRMGQISRAIELLAPASELADRELGPAHPTSVSLLRNYGTAEHFAGNFDLAVELTEDLIARAESVHGASHVDVLTLRGDLAATLYQSGRLEEAERAASDILATARSDGLSETHPKIIIALGIRARILRRRGAHEEAIPLFRQMLASANSTYGPTTNSALLAAALLGSSLTQTGSAANAVEVMEPAVRAYARQHGESHPEVLKFNMHLARALAQAGDVDQGLRLVEDAVAAYESGAVEVTEPLPAALRAGIDIARASGRRGAESRFLAALLELDIPAAERTSSRARLDELAESGPVLDESRAPFER